jgi:hypothetical protein
MSDRGSFITECIYCKKCFKAAKKILLKKSLCACLIKGQNHKPSLPIIAGRISELYSKGEIDVFKYEFVPELEKSLCHELRIAVLAEEGEEIFIIKPEILS